MVDIYALDITEETADRLRFRRNEKVLDSLLTQAFRSVTDRQISWAINIGSEHEETRVLSVKLQDKPPVFKEPSNLFENLVNAFAKSVTTSKLEIPADKKGPARLGDRYDGTPETYNGMVMENLIAVNPARDELITRVTERFPNYEFKKCHYSERRPGNVTVDFVFDYKWPALKPRLQSI